MKKAVLLIAALLMIGSMAFAATPSFGIWGRTLFTLAGGTSRTGFEDIYQGIGPNWDGLGTRLGLHTEFTTDKLGFKIVVYFNGAATNIPSETYGGNQNINVMSLFGTLKFVPDLLTVYVGLNNGDGWDFFRYENANVSNNINNDNCGRLNGWGLLVEVAPKDSGLTIVGQWKLPPPGGFDYWGGVAPPYSSTLTIQETMKNFNLGASYQIPDLMKIVLAYVTLPSSTVTIWSNAGANPEGVINDGGIAPTDEPDHNILARFHLQMIPDMTLIPEIRVWGFNVGDDINFKTQLVAAYALGDLWIGLGAWFGMVAEVGNYGINLEGKYNLGPVTVALGVNFGDRDMDADTGMSLKIMPWVLINDFNCRIAFEYYIHDFETSDEDNWWAIPIYFTFSIW